jgi:branched-chain amino acid transport system ATP-binding protein
MIEVKDIHSYYGKSHILHGVSLELKEGELVCLLGRNGVGKSTTLKSIMGIVRPTQGSIRFDGKELVGSQPYLQKPYGSRKSPDGDSEGEKQRLS